MISNSHIKKKKYVFNAAGVHRHLSQAGWPRSVCVRPPQHVGIVNGSWFRAASHPPPLAVSFSVNRLSHTQTYGLTYWQTDFGENNPLLPLLQTHWQQNTQSVVLCYEPHSLLCGFHIEPPFYTSIDCVNTGYSNRFPCFSSNYSHMKAIRVFVHFIVNKIIVTYGSSNSLSVFPYINAG